MTSFFGDGKTYTQKCICFGNADFGLKVRPLVQADPAKSSPIQSFKSCRPAWRGAVPLPRPAGNNIHFFILSKTQRLKKNRPGAARAWDGQQSCKVAAHAAGMRGGPARHRRRCAHFIIILEVWIAKGAENAPAGQSERGRSVSGTGAAPHVFGMGPYTDPRARGSPS